MGKSSLLESPIEGWITCPKCRTKRTQVDAITEDTLRYWCYKCERWGRVGFVLTDPFSVFQKWGKGNE